MLLLSSLVACRSGEKELTLLPDGYTGPVLVLYEQRDGQPREYRGNWRIFRIPASGVLKTQFNRQYYSPDAEYYYSRGDSLVRKIAWLDGPAETSADTSVYVFGEEAGAGSLSPGEDSIAHPRLHFANFLVGHLADRDSLGKRAFRLEFAILDKPNLGRQVHP